MRADRLLAILLLLQNNGRMSARQLAAELEVSERTIYRDVEALSISGVPVFTERGPGGGIELLARYRSDLTGLNKDEIRALFMLSIPAPLKDLGYGQEFRAALRKLAAALPDGAKVDEQRSRQRFFIDPDPWDEGEGPGPVLRTLQKAVWEERPLRVKYRSILGPVADLLSSMIQPYGLVAKEGDWFLVGKRDDHLLVLPVERIIDVQMAEGTADRPSGFDLTAFWQSWCVNTKMNRPHYQALVKISPDLLPFLPKRFVNNGEEVEINDGSGGVGDWPAMVWSFNSFEEARGEILKLGGGVEVLSPKALRLSVADFARQVLKIYQQEP